MLRCTDPVGSTALEWFEEARRLFPWNRLACVAHFDHGFVCAPARHDVDRAV
jgi:hypothetical protein